MKDTQLKGVMVPAIPLIILFSVFVYWSLSQPRETYLETRENHLRTLDSLQAEYTIQKLRFIEEKVDLIDYLEKQKRNHKKVIDSLNLIIKSQQY